jgi:hypothetical protein
MESTYKVALAGLSELFFGTTADVGIWRKSAKRRNLRVKGGLVPGEKVFSKTALTSMVAGPSSGQGGRLWTKRRGLKARNWRGQIE